MSETQTTFDDKFQANVHQNTPSYSDLEASMAADEAARHIPEKTDASSNENPPEHSSESTSNTEADDARKTDNWEEENEKRIARISFKEREARNELRLAREELARLSGTAPNESPEQKEERRVQQLANQIAEQKVFNKHCDSIYEQGVKEFPDFAKQLKNLHDNNIPLSANLIEAATEIGDPQKLLYYLAKNVDIAEHISSLSPTRMGAALAKLANKANPPKVQSKAAPPIKPIQGRSTHEARSEEDMSVEEICKMEDQRLMKTRGRR